MSFSTDAKNELARILPDERKVAVAELAAIIKSAGSIQIAGYKKINLKRITELNSIARKVFKLLKVNFPVSIS